MTSLMSYPVRLSDAGQFVTDDDASERYLAGELALLITTMPGERTLVPTYGIEDMAFDPTPLGTLAEKVEQFGPPVVVQDVTIDPQDDIRTFCTVEFSLIGDEDDDPLMLTDEMDV